MSCCASQIEYMFCFPSLLDSSQCYSDVISLSVYAFQF